ncbi:anterior gradient protein 2-like protein [Platysternon megacephalum]|uniref:Anterior gradient protein 2-like protein n=1 Tax=Platysternon megacephalum TaxID=55544 RepID=A0A4D9DT28_9SAUR|nr:anterior gradient protein 2-like protein [Platysternon megacephalum]
MRHDKRRGKYTPRSRQTATAALGARLVHHPQEVPQVGWVSGQSKNEGSHQKSPSRPPERSAVRVERTLVLTEEVAGTHGSDLATVRPGRKQDLFTTAGQLCPHLSPPSLTLRHGHGFTFTGFIWGGGGGEEKGKEGRR